MLNRISSFHNYQSVQNDLRRQENKVHHNQAQLASGKSYSRQVMTHWQRTIYRTLVSSQNNSSNMVTQSSWFVID